MKKRNHFNQKTPRPATTMPPRRKKPKAPVAAVPRPSHPDLQRVMGDFHSIHGVAVNHVGRTHGRIMGILGQAAPNERKVHALQRSGDCVAVEAFMQDLFKNPVVVLVWEDPDPRVPDMIAMVAKGSRLLAEAATYGKPDPAVVALGVPTKQRGEDLARLYGDWP